MEKALFIPLKTEYFNAFKNGTKDMELRPYGKRWNEKTCRVGRKVTLSKGYGKYERLSGEIVATKKQQAWQLGEKHRKAIEAIYGTLDIDILRIQITNLNQQEV